MAPFWIQTFKTSCPPNSKYIGYKYSPGLESRILHALKKTGQIAIAKKLCFRKRNALVLNPSPVIRYFQVQHEMPQRRARTTSWVHLPAGLRSKKGQGILAYTLPIHPDAGFNAVNWPATPEHRSSAPRHYNGK